MSKCKHIIGIDISKHTFDATRMDVANPNTTEHHVFRQDQKGFNSFVQWIQQLGVGEQDVLICMEHTGLYIHGLLEYLKPYAFVLWVEMPLRIKRSIGLQRGTDDKLSSKLIAQYAYRFQDACKPWVAEDSFTARLRHLTALRDRLVRNIKVMEVPVNELRANGCEDMAKELEKLQRKPLQALKKSIEDIEKRIEELVQAHEEAQKKIELVKSIKGISTQTAIHLYVYTKGFSAFVNAKQLASYCGVVPFERKSGISVRHRPRVSAYANKDLKRLLHLCAMCAIRHDKELRAYINEKYGKEKQNECSECRTKQTHPRGVCSTS
jgi:Transposase and inactivated derivatives